MKIDNVRRINLRRLVNQKRATENFSSDSAFCLEYGINPTYLSQITRDHGSFGEKAARNIEEKMATKNDVAVIKVEIGMLDRPITQGGETLTFDAGSVASLVQTERAVYGTKPVLTTNVIVEKLKRLDAEKQVTPDLLNAINNVIDLISHKS